MFWMIVFYALVYIILPYIVCRDAEAQTALYLGWPVAELTNISLSRGAPSLDIIAVDELQRRRRSAPSSATRRGTFAYGTSAGYPRLLEWIVEAPRRASPSG